MDSFIRSVEAFSSSRAEGVSPQNFGSVRALSSAGYTVSTRNETQYIVDDEALNRLRIGEAIVRMPDGNAHTPPFIVRLDEYKHKRG